MGTLEKFNKGYIIAILKRYLSNWKYFAISMVCCMMVALVVIRMSKTLYKTEARVMIVDNSAGGLGASLMKQFSFGGMLGGGPSVNDEIVRMTSYNLMRGVVKDMNLNEECVVKEGFLKKKTCYDKMPVDISCNKAILDTLRSSFEFRVEVDDSENVSVDVRVDGDKLMNIEDARFPVNINTNYGLFTLSKTEDFVDSKELSARIYFTGYDAATERYQGEIGVFIPNKKSDMISLEMINGDFKFSKRVIDKLISAYNKRCIEDEKAEIADLLKFVDDRIDSVYKKLNYYEVEIEAYKKANNMTDVVADVTYMMEKRGKVEALLIEAETEVEILKMTKDFISNPENKYSLVPISIGAESAAEAINAYNALVLERMKLESSAKSNNMSLRLLSEQIEAMRNNIVTSVDKAYETALVKYKELKSQNNQQNKLLAKVPTQEREFVILKRNQALQQELYLFMLQQREEMAVNIANTTSKGRVLDDAYTLTEPVSMSKRDKLIAFFLLGLILPIAYLYLRDLLRDRFSTKGELTKMTTMPIIGEIPDIDDWTIVADTQSVSAEYFRQVRSNLQHELGDGKKTVLVTSMLTGEGKTYIAVNIATYFAALGKKVLLVDMNLRNPQIGNQLGVNKRMGLSEYLVSGNGQLTDLIAKGVKYSGLDVISSQPSANSAELLQSKLLDDLMTNLQDEYDYIIIDSVCVGGVVSDTLSLNRFSDATVCVGRADFTTAKDITRLEQLKSHNRFNKMMIVLNGIDIRVS